MFTKKLSSENNYINILSLFSEMEIGFYLNQKFSEVLYEPKIFGKTPDWLVVSNGQKIIFEIKKINPSESEIMNRINLFLNDEYFGNEHMTFCTSSNDFIPQLHKIVLKEETYRKLITENGYRLVIGIDVINLHKEFFTDNDLIAYLDFKNEYSILDEHKHLKDNVAGILGKPIFGNKVFIENPLSNFGLNSENIKILNS